MLNGYFFILVFAISWLVNTATVLSAPWIMRRFSRADDHMAVQSAHVSPTPRLGGVGIVLAVIAGFFLFSETGDMFWLALLLSLIPVSLAGLLEDLGYYISPRGRLLAALASGVVLVAMQGLWITSIGVPGVDAVFSLVPLAIAITLIWSTGLCHAFNLIDGVNGLAGATGVVIGAGLALVSWWVGDTQMLALTGTVIAALIGFQLHNWPMGRIFLGDGGAYSVGHLLAWLGIALVARNPQVAGISIALFFFWPVADTLWAIYRRRRSGRRTDQPDRMHFHQLVMRTLEIRFGLRGKRHISNSLTSFVLTPFVGMPIVLGVLFYRMPMLGLAAMVLLAGLFVVGYLSIVGLVSYGRQPERAQPASKDRAPVVPAEQPVPVPEPAAVLAKAEEEAEEADSHRFAAE